MAYSYKYPRPALSADCVVVRGGKVLLIRRKNPPFMGRWALPGGFVEPGETLAEAARRELREETGLRALSLRQVEAFGDPGRDPRGWVVSVAFFIRAAGELKAGDDAADAAWFDAAKPPPLAFDHKKVLAAALRRGKP